MNKQTKRYDLASKLVEIFEVVTSIVSILDIAALLMLRETVSYEHSEVFTPTPKSNVFVIINNNQIMGYILLICLGIMISCTFIRIFIKGEKHE